MKQNIRPLRLWIMWIMRVMWLMGFMGIVLLISITWMPKATVYAAYGPVTQNTYGRVLQVIDGDALLIELSDNQKNALVRLAGITTGGNDEAFTYMTMQLLGRDVLVVLDEYYDGTMIDSRWTPVYIYHNNILYNQSLLQKGFAKMDDGYSTFALYNALVYAERIARSRGMGIWAMDPRYYYDSGKARTYHLVNINTATQAQLQDAMPELDTATARAIVMYRMNNPFRYVEDCMFSGGLTQEMFDRYGYLLTVYTNINTATKEELLMTGLTASEARGVIAYREEQLFTSIYQLNAKEIISYDKYRDIEAFITVKD